MTGTANPAIFSNQQKGKVNPMTTRKATKTGLVISVLLLAVWLLLGTTSSVAWFREEDTLVNTLSFGDMDIQMYYKVADSYLPVDQTTRIFPDDMAFEPGAVRIATLKLENNGSAPVTYQLSVVEDETATVLGQSVLGNQIDLADYLQFGLVIGDSEQQLAALLPDRQAAAAAATLPVDSATQSGGRVEPGAVSYAAVIIYMPQTVDNAANAVENQLPHITLGVSATVTQTQE